MVVIAVEFVAVVPEIFATGEVAAEDPNLTDREQDEEAVEEPKRMNGVEEAEKEVEPKLKERAIGEEVEPELKERAMGEEVEPEMTGGAEEGVVPRLKERAMEEETEAQLTEGAAEEEAVPQMTERVVEEEVEPPLTEVAVDEEVEPQMTEEEETVPKHTEAAPEAAEGSAKAEEVEKLKVKGEELGFEKGEEEVEVVLGKDNSVKSAIDEGVREVCEVLSLRLFLILRAGCDIGKGFTNL